MKTTTIIHENLAKAVTITNRFVPLRPSLPVLGNLLFKVSKGILSIAATNLESSIEIKLPVKETGSWELTIPAKILNEFLSSTKGDEVKLEAKQESLDIKIQDVKGTFAGIASSEFPKIPTENSGHKIEVEQKELFEAVNKVANSASIDEGKPVLTGVLIKNEETKTVLVATDGYRLSKKELKTKYNLEETLINAKTLLEVLKISGELGEEKINLSLSKTENQAIFSGESFLVASRILSGAYPNYNQIIPTKFKTSVSAKSSELLNSVKAAAVFARDIGNVVSFEIDGKNHLKVGANTTQIGQGEASMIVKTTGEPLKIAFNSRYLLDGLNNIESEFVDINFSGTLSPALLQDPNDKSFIYILMPVKAHN